MRTREKSALSVGRATRVTAAVALTVGAVALAPAAEAATAGSSRVSRAISPRTSISCTLTAHNPTYAGAPYGQYGTSTVQCTGVVQQIYLTTGLYYDGSLYVDSVTQTGDTFSSANGATQYSPSLEGAWTTGAIATITYPSGYTPATQVLGEVYSSTVNLQ